MNRATLIGNVGKDPEISVTQGGNKWARFPLATSETWKDKTTGEKKEKTEWHQIVVWNDNLIEHVISKYVKKGTKLAVEGQIVTRKWTDDKNIERYSTEIVLQGFGGTIELLGQPQGGRPGDAPMDNAMPPYGARTGSNGASNGNGAGPGYQKTLDDEIPF